MEEVEEKEWELWACRKSKAVVYRLPVHMAESGAIGAKLHVLYLTGATLIQGTYPPYCSPAPGTSFAHLWFALMQNLCNLKVNLHVRASWRLQPPQSELIFFLLLG